MKILLRTRQQVEPSEASLSDSLTKTSNCFIDVLLMKKIIDELSFCKICKKLHYHFCKKA